MSNSSVHGPTGKATFLLSLIFNQSHVRNVFVKHPEKAYQRELNRILWFVSSARKVATRLPIHVMVAGDRYPVGEQRLLQSGVGIVNGSTIEPPPWASKWHKLSFSKIAALQLTQFELVSLL